MGIVRDERARRDVCEIRLNNTQFVPSILLKSRTTHPIITLYVPTLPLAHDGFVL
jgi:hypothetical protein